MSDDGGEKADDGGQAKNKPHRYAGGAPEEETIVFDKPDISWELEWKEFKAAIREKREPLGSASYLLCCFHKVGAPPLYMACCSKRPLQVFIDTLFPLPYTDENKISYINTLRRGHHES